MPRRPVDDEERLARKAWGDDLLGKAAARGLTLTALAERAGVTQPTLSKWVKGDGSPDPVSALRLAEEVHEPQLAMLEQLGFLPPGARSRIVRDQLEGLAFESRSRLKRELFGVAPKALTGLAGQVALAILARFPDRYDIVFRGLQRGGRSRLDFAYLLALRVRGRGRAEFEELRLRELIRKDLEAELRSTDFYAVDWEDDDRVVKAEFAEYPINENLCLYVPQFLLTRPPALSARHDLDVSGIVTVGVDFHGGPDVMSALSSALGWGFFKVTDLTRSLFGKPRKRRYMTPVERSHDPFVTDQVDVATSLLAEPFGASRYFCWAIDMPEAALALGEPASRETTSPLSEYGVLATGGQSPFVVFLTLDEPLLKYAARQRVTQGFATSVDAERKRLRGLENRLSEILSARQRGSWVRLEVRSQPETPVEEMTPDTMFDSYLEAALLLADHLPGVGLRQALRGDSEMDDVHREVLLASPVGRTALEFEKSYPGGVAAWLDENQDRLSH